MCFYLVQFRHFVDMTYNTKYKIQVSANSRLSFCLNRFKEKSTGKLKRRKLNECAIKKSKKDNVNFNLSLIANKPGRDILPAFV